MVKQKIDFVIPWVDGADPEWDMERKKYGKKVDEGNTPTQFRDLEILKYWFRGVEKFAPWYNKIYFVTCGHVPSWLNLNHPRLVHVKHSDYIPEEYLPTFSANAIEMNLHRIKGLSENFVYFNDDTFIIRPMKETDFFVNGVPCEEAIEMPIITRTEHDRRLINYIRINDVTIINRHFKKREQLKKHRGKWLNPIYGKDLARTMTMLYWDNYAGFKDAHLAVAVKKSTLEKLWEVEPEILEATTSHRFRNIEDVNQYLIRYWQIVSGDFIPQRAPGKHIAIEDDTLRDIYQAIVHPKYDMICPNDAGGIEFDFDRAKKILNKAFNKLLPQKSEFEK